MIPSKAKKKGHRVVPLVKLSGIAMKNRQALLDYVGNGLERLYYSRGPNIADVD